MVICCFLPDFVLGKWMMSRWVSILSHLRLRASILPMLENDAIFIISATCLCLVVSRTSSSRFICWRLKSSVTVLSTRGIAILKWSGCMCLLASTIIDGMPEQCHSCLTVWGDNVFESLLLILSVSILASSFSFSWCFSVLDKTLPCIRPARTPEGLAGVHSIAMLRAYLFVDRPTVLADDVINTSIPCLVSGCTCHSSPPLYLELIG